MIKRYFFFLLLGLKTFTSSAQSVENLLQPEVMKFIDRYHVPAIAVAVVKPDSILYGLSGLKRIEKKDPVNFSSKFHLGSNTKAITAFVAAKLVEEGIINWDDLLIELIPELAETIREDYRQITLQDLLSHRALVQPFEDDNSPEFRHLPRSLALAAHPKLAFAKYALNLQPIDLAGKSHSYSNGGYIIAALMLEVASGKSWAVLIREHLGALGLDYFIGFPNQENETQTYGHRKRGLSFLHKRKYRSLPPNNDFALKDYFAPAGDISMNIVDLAHWIQFHLRGLLGEDNYLKAATYQKLHFGLPEYALGWYNGFIGDSKQKFSYHGGSTGTYSSAIIVSADRKIAIVILVNSEDKNTWELKEELRTFLWETYGVSHVG